MKHLRSIAALVLAGGLLASGQRPPRLEEPAEPKLPNGKPQREEILKEDFKKSLEDARELARLSDELKTELEKDDRHVLSVSTLKKTEEIEKLARRIRERLKRT